MSNQETETITTLIDRQRAYFFSGATLPISARVVALETFRTALRAFEEELTAAVGHELAKNPTEAYTTEIALVYAEIRLALKRIRRWARARRVRTDLHNLPARSRVYPTPYGVCAVLAPWNYPIQLALSPVVAALAAGNTVIIKPSELTPAVSAVLARMVAAHFSPDVLTVVEGDASIAQALVTAPLDKIFFTGSVPVGKAVMRAASERLTPITLELGGKSPVIIDDSADLLHAARKIAWGKFLNAGQTCVAPDYLLVHRAVADRFVDLLTGAIRDFFGPDAARSEHYGRIVNQRHLERLRALVPAAGSTDAASDKVVCGGTVDIATRFMAPTVIYPATWEHPAMKDEIFGPILPVLPVDSFDQACELIRGRAKPLAAYLFTTNRRQKRAFVERVACGGAGINTVVLQVASSYLPFGGVGPSGMGSYHGRAGFEAFTHFTSVLEQFPRLDPGLAYPGRTPPVAVLRRLME